MGPYSRFFRPLASWGCQHTEKHPCLNSQFPLGLVSGDVREKQRPSRHVPLRPNTDPAVRFWVLQRHVLCRMQVVFAVLDPWVSRGTRGLSVRPGCTLAWLGTHVQASHPRCSSPLSPLVCPLRTTLPSCCWPSWRAGMTVRTRSESFITWGRRNWWVGRPMPWPRHEAVRAGFVAQRGPASWSFLKDTKDSEV